MKDKSRDMVIGADAMLKGSIRNGRLVEVHGYVEGNVNAEMLIVHRGGRMFGTLRTVNAEVHGLLQGEVAIKNLISIGSSGEVVGNVRYGRIALESGGNLSAELRNIPPELAGDFQLAVARGRGVTITTSDLTAFDPDEVASGLTFQVSNARNGWVMRAGPTADPATSFTQSELEAGSVVFVHDGAEGQTASFDVVVADAQGATSGAAKTVMVAVR